MKKIKGIYNHISSSSIVKNSFWGVFSTLIQSVFVSVLFIILAREYSKTQLANFLIASTIYQLVVAFSSMGLGQWFIREYFKQEDRQAFVNKFFKIQVLLGIAFYVVNIILVLILYSDVQIRILGFILGLNVVFDNIIYALTRLNIAKSEQKRTAITVSIDSLLRVMIGGWLIIHPFSIIQLASLLVLVRFMTVNILLRLGAGNYGLTIASCWRTPIDYDDIKRIIFSNWKFVVIGCVYIVNWRFANILISKFLPLQDVANYEIAFKVFSLAGMLPAIASSTVYTHCIKYFNSGESERLKHFFSTFFKLYAIFAMSSYAFIYSFGDFLVPYIFGENYQDSVTCLKLMFLTLLFSATASLQANLIVAMKMEKSDMQFNIVYMSVNLAACSIGLYFYPSLLMVNYAIIGAVFVFHFLQDILLVRKAIVTVKGRIYFYLCLLSFVISYQYLSSRYGDYLVFTIYAFALIVIALYFIYRYRKDLSGLSLQAGEYDGGVITS